MGPRPEPPQPTGLPSTGLPSTGLPSTGLPAELQPFRSDSPEETARLLAQGLVRRVIADVVVAFDAPDSREIRVAAASLLLPLQTRVDPGWIVAFQSAAWLHLGSAGQPGSADQLRAAPAQLQVIIPPGRRRPRLPGVRGRQVSLDPDQVMFLDGLAVTDPVRTAADVARDLPAGEALTTLRQLGELLGVHPHQVIDLLSTMRYARGAATGRRLVRQWAAER